MAAKKVLLLAGWAWCPDSCPPSIAREESEELEESNLSEVPTEHHVKSLENSNLNIVESGRFREAIAGTCLAGGIMFQEHPFWDAPWNIMGQRKKDSKTKKVWKTVFREREKERKHFKDM